VVVKRLGLKVAVITRLHPDDFPRLEELRQEGVEGFATPADGTSGIANYYHSADMERRVCKPIGFGGKYELTEIPDFKTRMIMLSPLYAGEVDLPLLVELSKRAPVAMDIQGFVRVPVEDGLEFKPWGQMVEGLKCVTYLIVDKAERKFLTGERRLKKLQRNCNAMGPAEIVLTQSSGITAFVDGMFYSAPFTPRSLSGEPGGGTPVFLPIVPCGYQRIRKPRVTGRV
jgi:sugar/nucleoside kinase (ribokinase family)